MGSEFKNPASLARIFALILLLILANPVSADDSAVLRKVELVLGAQLDGWKNRELKYICTEKHLKKYGVQIWSEGRRYDATLQFQGEGMIAPEELTEAGGVTYVRGYGRLQIIETKSFRKAESMTPLDGLEFYALGWLTGDADWQRRFKTEPISVTELKDGNVEIVWKRKDGGTNRVVHALRLDYWPVSIKYTDANDQVTLESSTMNYTSAQSKTRLLYFPVEIQFHHFEEGKKVDASHYIVYPGTLKLDPEVPASKFVLEPLPFEFVADAVYQKGRKPIDELWDPVGKVEFPLAPWAMVVRESRAGRKWSADDRYMRECLKLDENAEPFQLIDVGFNESRNDPLETTSQSKSVSAASNLNQSESPTTQTNSKGPVKPWRTSFTAAIGAAIGIVTALIVFQTKKRAA